MFKPHDCGDSRLACIDCNGQVCPQCFIQCPVGNRCKQCSGKFTSHVLQASPAVLAKMGITALTLGAAFGAAQAILPGGGFFMWLIVYWIGVAAGNVIHKVGGFKIGTKVLATTTIAVCIGWYAVSQMPMSSPAYGPEADVEYAMELQQQQAALTAAANTEAKTSDPEAAAQARAKALAQAEMLRKQQIQYVNASKRQMKQYRVTYGLIDLIIFLAGIITVVSGQVPALRFPFFR